MKRTIAITLLVTMSVFFILGACAQDEDLDRSIALTGVGNARELGGYYTEDGKMVKHGVFLRTAALSNATEEDIARLQEVYHLAVVIDLRLTSEVESAPDPVIEGAENLHLGIIDETIMKNISEEDMEGLDLTNTLDRLKLAERLGFVGERMYIDFLSGEPGKEGYARMFRELLELPEDQALLFHCTQGKDRTGCAAMLILSALGVDEETIMYDYELTNTYNASLIENEKQMLAGMGIEGEDLAFYITLMDQVNPQYMTNCLGWIKDNYGSVLGYIRDALGITDAQIKQLRDMYLEDANANEDAA